ncbi:MAG: alanine/glycine:cation symporter family protein, partial [Oscillospiraceae bacterium]
FFGMATIYAEATMAQKYKHTDENGKVTGGPVYYIRAALHESPLGKAIAGAFAVFIILALGFMGNAVQSNSIADAFSTAFGIKGIITGVILAVVGLFIFVGGIKRIAVITEKMVPFMAVFYIVGSLIVIGVNFRNIPLAFYEIVVGAFQPQAIAGGVIGATMKIAMSKGIARGLFSNEAGMGSTPHAHAMAKVAHPSQQGFVAMIGVFIDTFVILNLTAFVIITSRSITPDGSLTGTALTQVAFSTVFGGFGNTFIAICMLFFAFSTIIGWYFFGETNVRYLFGEKAIKPYAFLVCVCIILGSLAKVSLIWDMSDCFNGLMVIPNLCGLLLLTSQVVDVKNDYFNNFKKNKAKAAAKK